MSEVAQVGHPKGLYVLFMAEMWERFCYYGMRVLLALYLTKSLMMGDIEAFAIYGAYTGLVYAAPVLGGLIADRLLGYRNAVVLGGLLMAMGEFMLLGGTETWLYIGMGAIIVGNGYFKANISTIVGKLYKDGDPRRDSGFTIFYIGINIGALLATTVIAYIGETHGFHWGFFWAGIGMLVGITFFLVGQKTFINVSLPKNPEYLYGKIFGPFNRLHLTIFLSILAIPVLYLLISNEWILNWLLPLIFVVVAANLILSGYKESKVYGERMIALVIFMIINIAFWACFEQAGTSLTLFADRNVDRDIWGWIMPASMTQFFNPGFIILFGSIFSIMWIKLSNIGKNPSLPMKFAYGILQLAFGFLIALAGKEFVNEAFQVPLLTLVVLYLLHTTGELFLSPIGLSMVTKLAPKQSTGTAMGGWFLSFSMANKLAGEIAKFTGAGGEGGGEVLSASESLNQYVGVFSNLGFVLIAIAVLVAITSPLLNKLMHGVR
ncbi:MAG: MFS transporter [Bacteroidetes bacterium]|nr:MFS transporter [Bacteroidota bacterium]